MNDAANRQNVYIDKTPTPIEQIKAAIATLKGQRKTCEAEIEQRKALIETIDAQLAECGISTKKRKPRSDRGKSRNGQLQDALDRTARKEQKP